MRDVLTDIKTLKEQLKTFAAQRAARLNARGAKPIVPPSTPVIPSPPAAVTTEAKK